MRRYNMAPVSESSGETRILKFKKDISSDHPKNNWIEFREKDNLLVFEKVKPKRNVIPVHLEKTFDAREVKKDKKPKHQIKYDLDDFKELL